MAKNRGKGKSIENKRKTCNVDVHQRINIMTKDMTKTRNSQKKRVLVNQYLKCKLTHKTPKTKCDMKLFLKIGLVLKMGPN